MSSQQQANNVDNSIPTEDTVYAGNPFEDPIPISRSRMAPSLMSNPMSSAGMMPLNMPPAGYSMSSYAPPPYPSDLYYSPPQPTICAANAPPVHPCKECKREIREDEQDLAIQCAVNKGCNYWFHRECSRLTEEAVKLLKNEPYADWVCDDCFKHKNIELVQTNS